MKKLSELVMASDFFQTWNGKRGTLKVNGETVFNQNSKLIKFKTTGTDSDLTINELSQLKQFEPMLLEELIENGVTINYQKFTIEIIQIKNSLQLHFTHKVHLEVTTLSVSHASAIKELYNSNINNDMLDIVQRIYQIVKD